jgi:hypothetical protein
MGTKGIIRSIQFFDALTLGNQPREKWRWVDLPSHADVQLRHDQQALRLWAETEDGAGGQYHLVIHNPIVEVSDDMIIATGFVLSGDKTGPDSRYLYLRCYLYLKPVVEA